MILRCYRGSIPRSIPAGKPPLPVHLTPFLGAAVRLYALPERLVTEANKCLCLPRFKIYGHAWVDTAFHGLKKMPVIRLAFL